MPPHHSGPREALWRPRAAVKALSPAIDEPGLLTAGKPISTKQHWGFLLLKSLLMGAVLTGTIAGGFLFTLGAGQAAKSLVLSFDGPTQVSQQSPYSVNSVITKDDLQAKYHIWLLTQKGATGKSDAAGVDHDWTQTELHTLDANLANTPALLYAKTNGSRLSFFIGSLTGIYGDVKGGVCRQECGAFYDQSFFFDGGLIGLEQRYYDINTPAFDQTIIDHELTHRRHTIIASTLDPQIKALLAGHDYLALPEFSKAAAAAKGSRGAIIALRSFADAVSDDPHINFEEGVAETSEIYDLGYRAFMMAFGPELNGVGCEAYTTPVSADLLAAAFPAADAFYRLWQDQVLDGFGYDEQGSMVPGALAIPTQLHPSPGRAHPPTKVSSILRPEVEAVSMAL